jgi:hypothetical protein
MLKPVRRAGVTVSLLALAAVTALGGVATAAPRRPSEAMGAAAKAAGSGGPGTLTVVAEGLANPRGIAIGPDGALYVAESGSGGPGPCVGGPEFQQCFGRTGAVTRITKRSQERILTGLPSVAEAGGFAATGPVDLGTDGKAGYLLMGNPGGGPETRQQFGPAAARFGKLLRVDNRGIQVLADFPRFEARHNPDRGAGAEPGFEIDSNPNGLLVRGRGVQLVADAGGNDLLKVDNGRISVVAVFPVRMVPSPPEIPGLPPEIPMQSVPTSVVKGPDGAYYVGELTGFPFPVGKARVYRVVPGQRPEVYARGFTNIIDIAFDKRGRLHVLEIAANGLLAGSPEEPPVGRLVRVNRNGSKTTLASEGLVTPGGFVLAGDSAYVTNYSVFPDTGPVTGQVVKVSLR